MLVFTLAAVAAAAYGSPQAAALTAIGRGAPKKPIVVRINTVGRYAVVLTKGGTMEGSAVTEPILVQRFSFGWQPLDMVNFTCRLESHHLGRTVEVLLMRGMPKPHDDRPCTDYVRDAGPPAEIEAIRRQMYGPLVPAVVVTEDWAMAQWYGAGGGEVLYQRRNGRWIRVAGGGGAMSTDEMIEHGVPRSVWCKLGVYNAKCSPSH